jgi:hypothetical protein
MAHVSNYRELINEMPEMRNMDENQGQTAGS